MSHPDSSPKLKTHPKPVDSTATTVATSTLMNKEKDWDELDIHQFVSPQKMKEIIPLTKPTWFGGIFQLLVDWLFIIPLFILVHFHWKWYFIFPTILVAGVRQLGFAIIMHDSAHSAIVPGSLKLNLVLGNLFGGWWIFQNSEQYRVYHLRHHAFTGSKQKDPDYSLTTNYPCSKSSLFRKFLRDFSGLSGIKALIGLLLIHGGYFKYQLNGKTEKTGNSWNPITFVRNCWGMILCHSIVSFFLFRLWCIWVFAHLFIFPFVLRVRSIAEHSVITPGFFATRSVLNPTFLENICFSPHSVRFHFEHHLMMHIPSYHLEQLHKIISGTKLYQKVDVVDTYCEVIYRVFQRFKSV